MSLQWRVTITDQHGEDHVFVVVAGGERSAIDKGRDYLGKQAPRGTRVASARAEIERRHADDG